MVLAFFAARAGGGGLVYYCVGRCLGVAPSYALSELDPGNLSISDTEPALNNMTTTGTSLLTADSFVVGTTNGNLGAFACVEMDDTVIDMTCKTAGIAFGSVRNISDPAQNAALPPKPRATGGPPSTTPTDSIPATTAP